MPYQLVKTFVVTLSYETYKLEFDLNDPPVIIYHDSDRSIRKERNKSTTVNTAEPVYTMYRQGQDDTERILGGIRSGRRIRWSSSTRPPVIRRLVVIKAENSSNIVLARYLNSQVLKCLHFAQLIYRS